MQIIKICPDQVVGSDQQKKVVAPVQWKLSHHQLAQTKIEAEN